MYLFAPRLHFTLPLVIYIYIITPYKVGGIATMDSTHKIMELSNDTNIYQEIHPETVNKNMDVFDKFFKKTNH